MSTASDLTDFPAHSIPATAPISDLPHCRCGQRYRPSHWERPRVCAACGSPLAIGMGDSIRRGRVPKLRLPSRRRVVFGAGVALCLGATGFLVRGVNGTPRPTAQVAPVVAPIEPPPHMQACLEQKLRLLEEDLRQPGAPPRIRSEVAWTHLALWHLLRTEDRSRAASHRYQSSRMLPAIKQSSARDGARLELALARADRLSWGAPGIPFARAVHNFAGATFGSGATEVTARPGIATSAAGSRKIESPTTDRPVAAGMVPTGHPETRSASASATAGNPPQAIGMPASGVSAVGTGNGPTAGGVGSGSPAANAESAVPEGMSAQVIGGSGGGTFRLPPTPPPSAPPVQSTPRFLGDARLRYRAELLQRLEENPHDLTALHELGLNLESTVGPPSLRLRARNAQEVSYLEQALRAYQKGMAHSHHRVHRAAFAMGAAGVCGRLGQKEKQLEYLRVAADNAPFQVQIWTEIQGVTLALGLRDENARARERLARWRLPSLIAAP